MNRFLDFARRPSAAEPLLTSLPASRQQAVQRMQIGLTGVLLMLLLVSLASVIQGRADQTDATTVPAAVAATGETAEPATQPDPLAEAGVVPDMPSEPVAAPAAAGAIPPGARPNSELER